MIRLLPRTSDGVAEPRLQSLDPGRASERPFASGPPAVFPWAAHSAAPSGRERSFASLAGRIGPVNRPALPDARGASGKCGIHVMTSFSSFLSFPTSTTPCVDVEPVRRSAASRCAVSFCHQQTLLGGEGCPIFQSEPIGYDTAHQMVETIFRQQLLAHGMAVREGQIKLCHAMLDALYNKEVTLYDAGVGLGKTYAYLVACLLWQSQRPRALWQPVVISTASVALQEAILQEYIPFLSSALLQYGYFDKPIQAVLRKGKERFVCDLRLLERQRQMAQRGERFVRRAAILRQALDCLDLDKLPGLSGFDRRQICVPEHCPRLCPMRSRCRYQRYLRESNGPAMSIQVCNHITCWPTLCTGRMAGGRCCGTTRPS